jgi:hypothetical protein
MRPALLVAAMCLLPIPVFAQGSQSFVQGFGGLRLSAAPTATPIAGATVGIGLMPYLQVVGEVGHIGDVLPSTARTLLSFSPVGFHRSATYGQGGLRLTTSPLGHVGVYGETLFGAARMTSSINGLGSVRNDVLANLALSFVSTTSRMGSLGTGVTLQGGPIIATFGYRYSRIFPSNAFDTLLMGGHADINEGRVSFGVRF